jgi:hypothetical protein
MSVKAIDPTDTYVIRELFGCGEGHALTPGFTHWESGEVCPHGHLRTASNEDVHLYDRLYAVPERRSERQGGGDMWEYLTAPENRGQWIQNPPAPKGLKEGQRIEPTRTAA